LAVSLTYFLLPQPASGQHQDIMVQSQSGQVVLGFADLESSTFVAPTTTFGAQLFRSATTGNWINSNPGFFSLASNSVLLPAEVDALPAGLDLFWDFLPMTAGTQVSNLYYWDGIDTDDNGLTASDVALQLPATSLELRLNSPGIGTGFGSAAVTGTPEMIEGKKVNTTAFDGSMHHHGIFRLDATSGAASPASGFYLISMHIRTAGALETSDPFFVYFDAGVNNPQATLALREYLIDNYDTLTSPPSLIGDFNADGIVDAADYTVWRDAVGANDRPEIDVDNSGLVDAGDYALWRSNFGATSAAAAIVSIGPQAVPEPGSLVLLLVGVAIGHLVRTRAQTR
jgi:hypothetical protein